MQDLNKAQARNGWDEKETDMLLKEIDIAEKEGKPIKSVFDKMAAVTGRKPNSIRNYYYMKLKDDMQINRIHTFTPFSQSEIVSLIEHMLIEQSKGRSVRSIAMSMGNGDKKAMLRYQNKFRSTIKNNPKLVQDIIHDLEARGICCMDPYRFSPKKQGTKDFVKAISEMVDNLNMAGADAQNIVESLNGLAKLAAHAKAERDVSTLMQAFEKERAINAEITAQLNELKAINKNFIELNGMNKISSLTEYVTSVKQFIDNCTPTG